MHALPVTAYLTLCGEIFGLELMLVEDCHDFG
jgi:hypothetical protein